MNGFPDKGEYHGMRFEFIQLNHRPEIELRCAMDTPYGQLGTAMLIDRKEMYRHPYDPSGYGGPSYQEETLRHMREKMEAQVEKKRAEEIEMNGGQFHWNVGYKVFNPKYSSRLASLSEEDAELSRSLAKKAVEHADKKFMDAVFGTEPAPAWHEGDTLTAEKLQRMHDAEQKRRRDERTAAEKKAREARQAKERELLETRDDFNLF